ncbi:MAG: DUF1161 domain-containing protein [Burkholderiaceae bacterium]
MTKSILACRLLVAALGIAAGAAAMAADNCDAVRADIDKKIRASGVTVFTLEVIDAAAAAPGKAAGKVVGNCAGGSRSIVYRRDAAPAAAAAAPVITECKDGSTPVNGRCPKK